MATRSNEIGPRPAPGRPRSAKREVGFTLIEVVVAFVMLSLVLAVVFEIFSTGFQRAGELEDRSRALVLAQSRLAVTGVEEGIKEGDTHGESDDRRFQWVVSVRRLDDGTPPPSIYPMYTINVRVAWRGGDMRERTLSLATMTLAPRPQ